MNLGQYYTLINTLNSLNASSMLSISTKDALVELRGRNRPALCQREVCFRTPPEMNGFFDPLIVFENGERALAVYDYDLGDVAEEFTPSVTMKRAAADNKVREDLEYEWVVAQVPTKMVGDLLAVAQEYGVFSWSAWCGRGGRRDGKLVWVAFLKATHESILAAKAAKEAAEAEAEAEYASAAEWGE